MNITKIKTNRLSVRIGLTLGIEIVLLLSALVIFITNHTRKALREEFIDSAVALTKSSALILNQRNSRAMQQLRLYTISDLALSDDFNTENCAEWLVNHRKLRYQDFTSLYYVDIATGEAYNDEGGGECVEHGIF